MSAASEEETVLDSQLKHAAELIQSSDRLLIVAAAGLSIHNSLPNNVYHSAQDFAHHYPYLLKYGYRTAYQTMGLGQDPGVPGAVKTGHLVNHMLNMRFNFPPPDGYKYLLDMASLLPPENVFCWTSNIDGCFERAGFPPERIYTTQGDMNRFQCPGECGIVWDCSAQLAEMKKKVSSEGVLLDLSLKPSCPGCGGDFRVNLRGGPWFEHYPYEAAARRLLAWLDDAVVNRARVAIIEVGVGPNTPVVTQIPATYFASALQAAGGHAAYIRINPVAGGRYHHAAQVPIGVEDFIDLKESWEVLEKILEHRKSLEDSASREQGKKKREYKVVQLVLQTPSTKEIGGAPEVQKEGKERQAGLSETESTKKDFSNNSLVIKRCQDEYKAAWAEEKRALAFQKKYHELLLHLWTPR